MKDELRAEALEQVKIDVKCGFEDVEDIFEGVLDMFYEETEFDENWLKGIIKAEFEQHNSESKNWKHPTDFEKLYNVFNKLNKSGIIALHKAGFTRQEGYEDVNEIKEIIEAEGVKPLGYCFYNAEDLELALAQNGGLYLTFGSMEETEDKGLAIGTQVAIFLKEEGFNLSWNGTVDHRILITPINWQKIYDDGLSWDMEMAVELMLEELA